VTGYVLRGLFLARVSIGDGCYRFGAVLMLCRGCVSRWLFASIDLVRSLCSNVVYAHTPSLFACLSSQLLDALLVIRNSRPNKFPRGRFGKSRRSTARGFIEAQATCPALRVGA
jgi:hypothetical protein